MSEDKRIVARLVWQRWAIYGPSGVGKTTLASTAPKPYFADSNSGLLSVASRPGFEHLRYTEIRRMRDLERLADKAAGRRDKKWASRYSSLAYDHFDDIQGIVMDEIGERAKEKDDRRDVDDWQQRDYLLMYNRMNRHLRTMKRIPMHKILVCGEAEDYDTGRVRPSLVGQMKTKLSYALDVVAYLRLGKKGTRWLHLDPTDEFYAKTRAWWLAPEWRKVQVKHDDTTLLTRIMEEIAKGPQASRSAKKRSTTPRSTKTAA